MSSQAKMVFESRAKLMVSGEYLVLQGALSLALPLKQGQKLTVEAAEGKLFHPLAFTKSFALLSSFILGIVVLPTFAYFLYSFRFDLKKFNRIWNIVLIILGIVIILF